MEQTEVKENVQRYLDKKMISYFMASLTTIPKPKVGSPDAKKVLADVQEMIKGIEKYVESKIDNL